MIGAFGSIVFEVSEQKVLSLNGLTETTTASFSEQEKFNTKNTVQFQGVNLSEITFSMTLNRSLNVDVENTIERLKAMLIKGENHNLILGNRRYGNGRYVITSLSTAYGIIKRNGKALTADINVFLKEYN